MQLVDHFNVLLNGTVNLNQSRLDQLQSRVDAVFPALQSDPDHGAYINGYTKQGSWAHRTIIRPVGGKEFDADILLEMDEVDGWEPKRYIEAVYLALHHNTTYGSMDHTKKCRCVRLSYANEMHIDIVPHVFLADGREVIVNRDDNEWEETNPTGFTAWMKDRDDMAKGNLRKVIRLVKFLRDHKNSFTGTPSIIITTLLGNQVSWSGHYSQEYDNVPKTLLHLVESLDTWLQAQWSKPSVADPSSPGTTFDHRWEDASFRYFRDRIHVHAAEIRAAYDEADKSESVRLWQEVFGDGFRAPAGSSRLAFAPAASAAASTLSRSGRAG
jgi:hypothetical protein